MHFGVFAVNFPYWWINTEESCLSDLGKMDLSGEDHLVCYHVGPGGRAWNKAIVVGVRE